MEVDLGEQEGSLGGVEFAPGYLFGQTGDDVLVAAELVLHVLKPSEDLGVAVQLEELELLAPELLSVVLCALDFGLQMVLGALVLESEPVVLELLELYPRFEVLQLLQQELPALLRVLQHLNFESEGLELLLLGYFAADFLVELLAQLYFAAQLLLVLLQPPKYPFQGLLFSFGRLEVRKQLLRQLLEQLYVVLRSEAVFAGLRGVEHSA